MKRASLAITLSIAATAAFGVTVSRADELKPHHFIYDEMFWVNPGPAPDKLRLFVDCEARKITILSQQNYDPAMTETQRMQNYLAREKLIVQSLEKTWPLQEGYWVLHPKLSLDAREILSDAGNQVCGFPSAGRLRFNTLTTG